MSPIRSLLSAVMLLLIPEIYGASLTRTMYSGNISGPRVSNKDRFVFERERDEPDLYLPDLWEGKATSDSMQNERNPLDSSLHEENQNLGQWSNNAHLSPARPQLSALHRAGSSEEYRQAAKREGHALSIVNPLDVLRQRLMLEMARRRMKENQDQIKANDVILKTLGKRNGISASGGDITKRSRNHGMVSERRSQTSDEYLETPEEGASEEFDV